MLLKGLPLAYNKDLQEDKLYVFGTKEELDLCLQAMTAMVEGLTFDADPGARGRRGRLRRGDGRGRLSGGARACRSATRTASPAGWWPAVGRRDGRWPSAGMEELREPQPAFRRGLLPGGGPRAGGGGKVSPGGTAPRRVAEQLALARPVLQRLVAS